MNSSANRPRLPKSVRRKRIFLGDPSNTHAEGEPAATEVMDRSGLLCDHQWVARREHQDSSGEPNGFSAGGEVAERGEGLQDVAERLWKIRTVRRPEAGTKLVQDPVYFCSAGCRSKFEKDPARYTAQVSQLEHAGRHGHSPVTAAMPRGEMEQHQSAIDPVCGMTVDTDRAEYRSFQQGETYYFCSAGCKETFDSDPSKYITRPNTEPAG